MLVWRVRRKGFKNVAIFCFLSFEKIWCRKQKMGCFLGCFRFKDKEHRGGVQATSQAAKKEHVTPAVRPGALANLMDLFSSLVHWLKIPPARHEKLSSLCTNIDDKPISGCMPVQNSRSISPAKSPSSKCSENYDRPILGLVGAHWKEDVQFVHTKWWDGKGIPNSTNKYKEDQKVSWHSTPFEERLEKALSSEGVGGRELFC